MSLVPGLWMVIRFMRAHRGCEMVAKRRIWELRHSTICRILGLVYGGDRLKAVYKDLKLEGADATPYELHQHLVQLCRTQSRHARRIEQLLEKQFAPYKKYLGELNEEELCDIIENRDDKLKEVPLSALIWFAVRNGNGIEARITRILHLKEFCALRLYDELARRFDGEPESIIDALNAAMDSNEKLQYRCARLERKRAELIAERDALKSDKTKLVQELESQKRLNERLESLKGEHSQELVESMRIEISILREELKRLRRESQRSESAARLKRLERSGTEPPEEAAMRCRYELKGLRVAYIGGVESLKLNYKEVVESFGCMFCYHCGHCMRGRKEIEEIVERNDIIVCPVDINSHNACQMIKEACKSRNKPCYFLRSSGLSALRKTLASFKPGYGM